MMYSRTSFVQVVSNTMNKKSNTQSTKVKNLQRQITNLNRRLLNNAPVGIASGTSNTGKDYYKTSGNEKISTVSSLSTNYQVTGTFINPANANLFPWLSGIAKKYDLYRFKSLSFHYKPSQSTSIDGNVYLGVDYNTLDPAPGSSDEFCQLTKWTTNVAWKPMRITLDLKGSNWYYTRSGPVANADYKTYDIGKFFVAVEGISTSTAVGQVYVTYEVEFSRRQPDYVTLTPSATGVRFAAEKTFVSGLAIGPNSIIAMGASAPDKVYNPDSLPFASGVFTLTQPGTYMVRGLVKGSSSAVGAIIAIDGVTPTVTESGCLSARLVTSTGSTTIKLYASNLSSAASVYGYTIDVVGI